MPRGSCEGGGWRWSRHAVDGEGQSTAMSRMLLPAVSREALRSYLASCRPHCSVGGVHDAEAMRRIQCMESSTFNAWDPAQDTGQSLVTPPTTSGLFSSLRAQASKRGGWPCAQAAPWAMLPRLGCDSSSFIEKRVASHVWRSVSPTRKRPCQFRDSTQPASCRPPPRWSRATCRCTRTQPPRHAPAGGTCEWDSFERRGKLCGGRIV